MNVRVKHVQKLNEILSNEEKCSVRLDFTEAISLEVFHSRDTLALYRWDIRITLQP